MNKILYEIMEPESSFSPSKIAVGIDFGTTNSLISYIEEGQCKTLADKDGSKLLPSIVAYQNNHAIVGSEASLIEPHIISIKRILGKRLEEIKEQELYHISQNNNQLVCSLGGLKKSPVEIASDIFKALRKRTEALIDSEIIDAVVTVPAYFNDDERNAVKKAAQIAGFNVMRLINEPTAAAFAYGLENGPEGTFMIYDLGGGTFDVSILKMTKGVFQVIATAGDNHLGGDDLDIELAKLITAKRNIDFNNPEEYHLPQLLKEARNIKHYLSKNNEYNSDILITTSELENSIKPYIEKTINIIQKTLNNAELTTSDIDSLILVGGATRIPYIKNKLSEQFNILDNIDPEQIVSKGAAIKAHDLSHNYSQGLLIDVTPLSLGIELADGAVETIISANTPISASYKQVFTTGKDNQTAFVIHILQGEAKMVNECRSLAYFELKNLPAMPAGQPRLEINFKIDADGILTVEATELTTQTRQKITVKPSYGLDLEEIKKLRNK